MKKFRFTLLLLLALTAGLNSCVDPDDIRVLDVEGIAAEGISRIDLTLRIENRGRKASIESGKLNLVRGTMPMVDVVLRERIEVPRKTTASIPVSLQMKAANPLIMIGIAQDPLRAFNAMTVSGELTVKACVRKKIRFEEVPFPEFLRILGVDTQEIIQAIQP